MKASEARKISITIEDEAQKKKETLELKWCKERLTKHLEKCYGKIIRAASNHKYFVNYEIKGVVEWLFYSNLTDATKLLNIEDALRSQGYRVEFYRDHINIRWR